MATWVAFCVASAVLCPVFPLAGLFPCAAVLVMLFRRARRGC